MDTVEPDAVSGAILGDNASPVLRVRGLSTAFRTNGGWRNVVRGLDFDIAPRETVAIVGESGSGKSVTALSIMRLLPGGGTRLEGSVKLGGRELLGLPERAMEAVRGNEVAMIFQEPMTCLNPVMTIGKQVAEALYLHGGRSRREAREAALVLLERVRIPAARQRFDEYPHRLSGGMRQRVMIAMALACRPKLLIADEPTTALDVTIQAEILDLIAELRAEVGSSVLFITHDMGVVAEIADRTLVMLDGALVEAGSTSAIFAAARHAYTRRLLAAVPALGAVERYSRPVRFPTIDPLSGEIGEVIEAPETVETGTPVLDVRNLVVRFRSRGGLLTKAVGRVHAVENISFTINPGETLALVGESGCGKSTTGRAIVGLVRPEGGRILVDGTDIEDSGLPRLRKRVQMIFQDPFGSLDPRQLVGAAIAEPLRFHKLAAGREIRERVTDLLEKVGLTADMASRYPHEFSGGQRQRICIARALALSPKLIIADEAVSALDVSIKAQVINLMLELQEKLKLAFLFISHDMAVVERVSHRVAVMRFGEIVEIGPRAAVFGNPQHPYTKRLLAAVPVPDPARRRQRGREVPTNWLAPAQQTFVAARQYRDLGGNHIVQVVEESAA